MCNHDRSSPHVLTGRATKDGALRVGAGANVKAGSQVTICYGGGLAGNDRFLQDYGFLDAHEEAYRIVARQLMGKVRLQEGVNVGKTVPQADRDRTLARLRETTIEQDEALLEKESDGQIRTAIEYRIGLKKALAEFITL
jgi:hypothetical protein